MHILLTVRTWQEIEVWHCTCCVEETFNRTDGERSQLSSELWKSFWKKLVVFLRRKTPAFKEEVLRCVGHQVKFTIILPCAVEVNNVPANSQLMRCTIISSSNLWLYYLLNVSKDNEQWNVTPEGEKPPQDRKGEIMWHDECEII